MKKISYFLWLSFPFLCNTLFARGINEQLLQNYPASVILRVYELSSNSDLPDSVQLEFARLLKKSEDDLSKIMLGAKSSEVQQWLKQNCAIQDPHQFFLSQKISLLRQADTLTPVDSTALTHAFIKQLNEFPMESMDTNFKIAMSRSIHHPVFYGKLYEHQISEYVKEKLKYYMDNYKARNHSEWALSVLEPIVLGRVYNQAINKYMYYYDSGLAKKMNDSVLMVVQPQIDRITTRDKGYPTSKSFALALDRKKDLGLSNVQVDSLTNAACRIRVKMKNKEIPDTWKEEQPFLVNLLSPTQMDHLLAIKYKDRAENEAVEMWGKIKYYKFSSGMDSVRVVKQIAAYQLSQYKINGKYMNDEKKRKSHTTDLARTKPKAMEMLKIAEQNSAILNKDRHFNGFAW